MSENNSDEDDASDLTQERQNALMNAINTANPIVRDILPTESGGVMYYGLHRSSGCHEYNSAQRRMHVNQIVDQLIASIPLNEVPIQLVEELAISIPLNEGPIQIG
jgi:uncharacterized ParB-like nuclease family protein